MRYLQIFVIALLVIVIGYFIWQTVDQSVGTDSTTSTTLLQLNDLPLGYCPETAKVVTSLTPSATETGKTLRVNNCRSINLSSIQAERVYIKLPHALAFAVSPSAEIYAPQLGDVNEDGSINDVDERLVTEVLFTIGVQSADLDADQTVTATDLALVRLHQGVSATAGTTGDQIDWEAIK